MKKMIFILASLFAFSVFSGGETVKAQGFSININIGVQPAWGPVGYDYVEFYYIPEVDCYYDVPRGLFYYVHNGRWISGRYLPPYYSRYDLYRLHKVVINGYSQPWRYHQRHYPAYRHYVGRYDQRMIRYSRDTRYEASRRNRYDWVENGRDLHRRSNRTYSEGQSSGRTPSRNTEMNGGRNSSQGRQSTVQNSGRTSTNQGRSSSMQNSPQQRSESSVTSRPSGSSSTGRGAGTTVRSSSQRESSSSGRSSSGSSSSSSRGTTSSSGRSSSGR